MPQWDVAWHPNGRHILENERGLSAVRERRVRESSGAILAFVDDVNGIGCDTSQPHAAME